MRGKYLNLLLATFMILLMVSSTSADYINTGSGTQNFKATSDNQGIKGMYIPFSSIDPVRTETINSGTWITVGFSVTNPEPVAQETCQDVLVSDAEFLEPFNITAIMDGIIIKNLYDPLNPEYADFMFTDDGLCYGLVSYRYYIHPLSVGNHLYRFIIDFNGFNYVDSTVNLVVVPHGR